METIAKKSQVDYLKKFYVVTASGSVYEVKYTEQKTTVRKIYIIDPEKSKIEVGTELFPEAKFVCITMEMGLQKCQPGDGKKFSFEEEWNGHILNTSSIRGLFLKKESALKYCKGTYNYQWYKTDEAISVIQKIGKDHPVFILSERLYPKEENTQINFDDFD